MSAKNYSTNYIGPRRGVIGVWRLKRRSPEGFNYVIELMCGHRLMRRLWRDCSDVPCSLCRDGVVAVVTSEAPRG